LELIVTLLTADADRAGLPLSVTATVNLEVPAVVAVPEIVPVVAANAKPMGRLPEVIDQLYGAVPPVACNVCE
jgi:hypothetical protein